MREAAFRPPSARAPNPDAAHWLEALPAPVLGVDSGERIRFVNAAAADLLGAAGRGLLGRRLDEVLERGAPIIALVQRAIAAGARVAEADLALTGPGLALGRVSAAAAPVGDQGYFALVLTPAPRPRAPAGAGAAARTLAHEVRNPLAGIRAAAQLIGRGGDLETAELAQLICDEVDRVNRLTERIDPIGALQPSRRGPVNVHEALSRVRQLLAPSAPEVTFSERYDPSLPLLHGDFDQLIQAFLNIAKNAVEALSGRVGGEVTFITAYRPGVRVRAGPNGKAHAQLEVQIVDNGPGVDAAIADRVFEAFATTKAGGMGLGLNISADIIGRHDGSIGVESAPGRTTFRIWLPIEAESEAP